MKKLTFWEKIDGVFGIGTFLLLLLMDLVFLLPTVALFHYDLARKDQIEHLSRISRTNDRLINEVIRPEIETKYKTKAFRVKSRFNSASVRVETDGAGQYAGITEDFLELTAYADTVDFRRDRLTPEERADSTSYLQLEYVLEFDHGSEDGGVTVFCTNRHRHSSWDTAWHTHELWRERRAVPEVSEPILEQNALN